MLEWVVDTQKEAIVEERKRLILTMHERQVLKHHNGYIPAWIPPWLAMTDEEHATTNTCEKECKNCGNHGKKWIETSFSFCDEYGCGIAFCEKCAKDLSKKFKKLE